MFVNVIKTAHVTPKKLEYKCLSRPRLPTSPSQPSKFRLMIRPPELVPLHDHTSHAGKVLATRLSQLVALFLRKLRLGQQSNIKRNVLLVFPYCISYCDFPLPLQPDDSLSLFFTTPTLPPPPPHFFSQSCPILCCVPFPV